MDFKHGSHSSNLELAQPIPGPLLCDELPQDDTKAEDVTLGRYATEGIIEAFGSPAR